MSIDSARTLDRLIDSACGLPRDWRPAPLITLRCPRCQRTLQAPLDKTDLPGTVSVETLCPDCCQGDFSETLYFDATGSQIYPTDEAQP